MKTFNIVFEDDYGRINKIWVNSTSKNQAIEAIKNLTSPTIRIIFCIEEKH